jgi:hypothetical protein
VAGLAGGRFGDAFLVLGGEKNETDMVAAKPAFCRAVQVVSANFSVKRNGQVLAGHGIVGPDRAAPIEGLQIDERHQLVGLCTDRKKSESRFEMFGSRGHLLLGAGKRNGEAPRLPRRVALLVLAAARAQRGTILEAVKRQIHRPIQEIRKSVLGVGNFFVVLLPLCIQNAKVKIGTLLRRDRLLRLVDGKTEQKLKTKRRVTFAACGSPDFHSLTRNVACFVFQTIRIQYASGAWSPQQARGRGCSRDC